MNTLVQLVAAVAPLLLLALLTAALIHIDPPPNRLLRRVLPHPITTIAGGPLVDWQFATERSLIRPLSFASTGTLTFCFS